MRGTIKTAAAFSLVALLAAACGSSTSKAGGGSSSGAAASGPPKGCMVTDTGGINDRSFNASSWLGMEAAQKADPSKIAPYPKGIKYLQSTSASNYTPNIGALLGQKCGIIFTVGFDMGPATQTAAKAHPSQHFAIVDFNYTPSLKNVDGLLFNTVQAAFLGGYLAAGMTKTGKVATFGGQNIPPVTIYMDGFWDGVQYYNAKHHTHVQVLGWSEVTQKGSFTGDFTNTTKGEQLTGTFLTEGADIILPVAGQVGLGAAKAVQLANARGFKANLEWVDTDGCISAPQYCQYFITSVEKGITTAVKTAFLAHINGTFTGGTYVGTLANGGVGIAPFHDFASKVPASLQSELAAIQHGIEMGTIKTPTHAGV